MKRLASLSGLSKAGWVIAVVAFSGVGPASADIRDQPAELPPPDYAGQQYVDSAGCAFLRAGSADRPVWLPRVTRKGVPVCGYPASGVRVSVAASVETPPTEQAQPNVPVDAEGFLVQVGSYVSTSDAEGDAQKLNALGLPVHRGTAVKNGKVLVTVFAGPFETGAEARSARRALRSAGFRGAKVMRY